MSKVMIAVAVAGDKNLTRITNIRPLCDGTMDQFAKIVARKQPDRLYYIVEVSERSRAQRKKGDPLYVWHVGDGFEHASGWWTEME